MNAQEKTSGLEDPLAHLEQALIDEYVRTQGYDPLTLAGLPEEKRQAVLKAAVVYAAAKLAEVESRAHFVHEIHGEV